MRRSVRMRIALPWLCLALALAGCGGDGPGTPTGATETAGTERPASAGARPDAEGGESPVASEMRPLMFKNASVHDPSIIRTEDGTFYVFGSHLAVAKSDDLIHWTQVNSGVYEGNPVIPNVFEEMAETFEWAQTRTFWAGDVVQLPDGKYYMYYSACKGDSPRSALGLAVADHIEGPYRNAGILLKSGMWGQPSEDGTVYDAARHPNTVDPHVFFDKEGQLWMVYGSYSGGIYILKMDPATGRPLPGQGYGKKLLGANHSRIEGPYMLYSPETDYYYLFLSFGGLDAKGGYNIRVVRSRRPDGPFVDAEGNDMTKVGGGPGSFFDDRAIEPYGVKLMGNFQFQNAEGEIANVGPGYVSPGHNSAWHDAETGRYFLIFHTRFPSRGEAHEVRVHQMWMNADGWPVVAPHRYTGETIGAYTADEVAGAYKFIRHGKDISADIKKSELLSLNRDGSVDGAENGSWKLDGDHRLELTLGGETFKGVFVRQWDPGTFRDVMTFTALSSRGEAVWGSHVAPNR